MTAEELKHGIVDVAFKALDRFGVAVVILAVVLYFAREAAIALHETLVKPVVESHIEFLDATRETLSEIGDVQQRQAATLEELAAGQQQIIYAVDRVVRSGTEPPGQN